MTRPPYYMVFDVESIGLHGEGFAVGWIVVRPDGTELYSAYSACMPYHARGDLSGHQWIAKNVPELVVNARTPREVRERFWLAWKHWVGKGAVLVADCAWPVEARFLAACVDDDPVCRDGAGPYPLHDLASVLLALGRDPLATNERLPDELPAHNPLCDARQSARLLIEALRACDAKGAT